MEVWFDSLTASMLVSSESSKLFGFSFKATTDVELTVYNGTSSSGDAVLFVTVEADESVQQWLPTPLRCSDGLYFDVSGTIEGTVWYLGYSEADGEVSYPFRDDTRGANTNSD